MVANYNIINKSPSVVRINPQLLIDRLDCNFYDPKYLILDEAPGASHYDLKPLGSKSISTFLSHLPGFSKDKYVVYKDVGVPYLLQLNIGDGFIDLAGCKYIDKEVHKILKTSQLKPGNVVVTTTGALHGKAAVIPETLIESNACPDVTKIICSSDVDPYYLSAYINSRFGYNEIRRQNSGAGRPRVIVEYLRKTSVLKPPFEIQSYIGSKVRLAEKFREEAIRFLKAAKDSLSDAIGFDLYNYNISPKAVDPGSYYKIMNTVPGCIIVSPILIENAINAERYSPDVLAREEVFQIKKIKMVYLSDIAEDFINGYDCRDFKPEGTSYLKVQNIKPNSISLDKVQYVPCSAKSINKKFQLVKGDLLITRKGSFGICTTVLPNMEDMIISSEIIRVPIVDGWDSDFIALFLNSPFGSYQFRKLATGTMMKGINHENLAEIKIPKLEHQIQKDIGRKVRNFMELTQKTDLLISDAKTDVEKLIEGKLDTDGIISGKLHPPIWEEIESELYNTNTQD